MIKKAIGLVLSLLLMTGCNPDHGSIEIYTSDIEIAATEVIEVPASFEFSILGDDDDGTLDRVVEISKGFLSKGSEFVVAKTDLGEKLVIQTTIPMGSSNIIGSYVDHHRSVAYVEINAGEITLRESVYLKQLSDAVAGINMMLSAKLPAKNMEIRVVSDTRDVTTVGALAVFVTGQAYYVFEKDLKRRDSVEMNFKGTSGSIYSELPVVFAIKKAQ